MPTSNIPFTYACRLNGSVHLYIVIYAAQRPDYPEQESRYDATMRYFVGKRDEGTDPHFMHYTFNINGTDNQGKPYTITNIEVRYDGHIRKILVGEHDLDTVDAVPSLEPKAFDVPYAYTQMGEDDHHFWAEIVLYAETAKKFKCVHSGPLEEDEDGNTESNITIDASATAVTVFSASNEFEVDDVLTTDGEHAVTFTEGNPPKEKRSKTKNKNHSQTPFPGS